MDKIIDELQTVHEEHVRKLTKLHEIELARLNSTIESLRQESAALRSENEELSEVVRELNGEVEGIRGDFDLIQGRLGKIIVEEDDLIELINKVKLFTIDEVDVTDEVVLLNQKSQNDAVMLTAMKYLKKLEGSDPFQLCRLLEIPFNPPDRPFALSNSLLSSISVHLSEDPATSKIFNKTKVAPFLLEEIIKLKLTINEIAKCFLKNSRKSSKLVGDEAGGKKDLVEWLIDAHEEGNGHGNGSEFSPAVIISSFLSNFK